MNPFLELRNSAEFARLRTASAELGKNPLQVQGPGGNTSLKKNGRMWIKASGTWLAEANERDIMVPVDADRFCVALNAGSESAEDTASFLASVEGAPALHSSIETSVHAILDTPVVLHTHCVATIAVAARTDAEEIVRHRLAGLDAVFIPYFKPGLDLARGILERITAKTKVLILGNHGLVATGDTVKEALQRIYEVSCLLEPVAIARGAEPNSDWQRSLKGSGWKAAPFPTTQSLAFDDHLLALANGNSLYPDHVVFLGPGCVVANDTETAAEAAVRGSKARSERKLVICPGQGVAVPETANAATLTLVRAFGDVLVRVDPSAELERLTDEQEDALINWDAEKLRQSLNSTESARA
ncbi:class II aldolase/adducin family protein [uncultured Roseibium sp.]|uniref:class II aldolase/adducin family protein n=1 Tax=uncultured Roseibium sp. TaxID=1936171 RepID=UPI00262877C0|nr:class II aldolase/adducin family protein [uncultured Roseibium sp.]